MSLDMVIDMTMTIHMLIILSFMQVDGTSMSTGQMPCGSLQVVCYMHGLVHADPHIDTYDALTSAITTCDSRNFERYDGL